MKISKLLVLMALLLTGGSAWAADLIERTAPTAPEEKPLVTAELLETINKTPQEVKMGVCYVAYNTGAQQYFTEGNNWGTRASVGDIPLVVRFELPSGKKLEDQALFFYDYSKNKGSWKKAFFDSETAMFVDLGSQANYYWGLKAMGNNVYRLFASSANPSLKSDGTTFVGRNPDEPQNASNYSGDNVNRWPLSPFLKEDGKNFLDWVFYEAPFPEWTAYYDAQVVYEASVPLKELIELAEEEGVDVSAAVEVYNNENATVEDFEQAVKALQKARIETVAAGATVLAPVDVTAQMLLDPGYDNQASGWQGSKPAFGGGAAEFYNTNYNHYQTVAGALEGVYVAKLKGYYRAGSTANSYNCYLKQTGKNAMMYAVTGNDTITKALCNIFAAAKEESFASGDVSVDGETGKLWVPNNMTGGAAYFDNGDYENELYFGASDQGVTLGLLKTTQISTDWTLFDNWTVEYLGASADAYQTWVTKNKEGFATITTTASKRYKDAFDAVNTNVSTYAEAYAAIKALTAAYNDLAKSAALYVELNEVMSSAQGFINDDEFMQSYRDELKKLTQEGTLAIRNANSAKSLTNEEMRDLIDRIVEGRRQVILHPDPEKADRVDMSILLKNAGFDITDTNDPDFGWVGRDKITDISNSCAEAYEKNPFDFYQLVQEAPHGVYEIQLQGFYRLGPNDQAWPKYQAAVAAGTPQDPVAWVYLNKNSTALNNLYDITQDERKSEIAFESLEEAKASFYTSALYGPNAYGCVDTDGTTYWVPNGMSTSKDAFERGFFAKSALGLVMNDGDELRVGIKGALGSSTWAIWDSFKLYYRGYKADIVKPVLEEEIAAKKAEYENVFSKAVFEMIEAAVANGNTALGTNDGTQMFNALAGLMELNDTIASSKKVFTELLEANKKLLQDLTKYEDTATETAIGEGTALYESINDNAIAHVYEDADVPGLLEQIKVARAALRRPAFDPDNLPADFTEMIENYNYTVDGSGWSGTEAGHNAEVGVSELFNKTFDYYQDLIALPEGTYEVRLTAFYRFGEATEDYASLDSAATTHAFFYAMASDGIVRSKELARLGSEANESTVLDEGYAWAKAYQAEERDSATQEIIKEEIPGWYVPNTMATGSSAFDDEGLYKNEGLFVKVAADGKLRIGLKKNVDVKNDWTLFDNWELWYYGKDSDKPLSDDPSGITDMSEDTAARIEFFTIDGRKATQAQRGLLIMKQTTLGGKIIVKKIQK